jgi:3-oxoacyl-[acyl-carrier protein] reductase
MTHYNGKTAIVTGASRGIGAAIAQRLAADGFAVVINYAASAAPAEELAGQIVGQGGKAIAIAADIADAAAVAAMFEATVQQFGGVDVLVNNAGVMDLAPIAQMDDATFDRMVAINFKGTFNTLREATKHLRDGGRIINTSSSVTRLRQPGYGPYAATKAAVEAMTAVMAKEMRGRHITVNAIAPGPTATELFLKGKPEQLVETIANMAPLERLGQPDDIAAAVAMLAGTDGAWINGQTIFVNGGVI